VNDSAVLNRQTGERAASGPPHEVPSRVSDGRVAIAEPLGAARVDAAADPASAFRALVGAALDDAYRRATVLLGDRFEAEDAVHDAAEKAWRGWGGLRDESRLEAWFGRILVNTCRDRLRRRRRVQLIEVRTDDVGAPSVSSPADRAGEGDLVRDALSRLSPDERIAVVLRYEADLTVPAIAALVGVPEGTVKSRLHHALHKVRVTLEGDPR
jgi:RNA polymerase sigma-70 factor (ECF subfamily)